MIHLFDRIYLKHDNVLTTNIGQQKLIITDKEFEVPYTNEKYVQQQAGILGVYDCMSKCDEACGGRDQLWAMLLLKSAKTLVIARKDIVAELLIQYWKSIFKTTDAASLYLLYALYINNENLHSYRPTETSSRVSSPNSTEAQIEKIPFAEFEVYYQATDATPVLAGLKKQRMPFEVLLMSYMSDSCSSEVRKSLFQKVDAIVKTNIVARLTNSREEMLFETHNYYLTNPGKEEEVIIDPIDYIKNSPYLAWMLDDVFLLGNEDAVLEKYTLAQLRFFFQTHQMLLGDDHPEIEALNWLENKQYAALINFDVNDHKGNYFGISAFVNKINGLLVSYVYQLKRLGQEAALKTFELN